MAKDQDKIVSHADMIVGFRDVLSELAIELLELDETTAYEELTVSNDGRPKARQLLNGVSAKALFKQPPKQTQMANLALGGIWLWHDWLDESHGFAQAFETPDGSFLHAIMHRREGDFSNSKYWFARAGNHPVLAKIGPAARSIISAQASGPNASQVPSGLAKDAWNPAAFVNWVQSVEPARPGDENHRLSRLLAVSLQRLEWRALFAHFVQSALG